MKYLSLIFVFSLLGAAPAFAQSLHIIPVHRRVLEGPAGVGSCTGLASDQTARMTEELKQGLDEEASALCETGHLALQGNYEVRLACLYSAKVTMVSGDAVYICEKSEETL